jgi:sulfate transport system ATP-binding protein
VEPQVLLLDEPFGALDAQVRKELRTWLRRLHDEVHVTTVFVTHDQEEAIEVADTIVVLAGGVVEQTGTPQEIYDHPASPFVMRFLGPVTEVDGRLVRPHDIEVGLTADPESIPATVTRVVRLGFEVRVEMRRGDQDTWAQITRAAAERLGLQPGDTVHMRLPAAVQP